MFFRFEDFVDCFKEIVLSSSKLSFNLVLHLYYYGVQAILRDIRSNTCQRGTESLFFLQHLSTPNCPEPFCFKSTLILN